MQDQSKTETDSEKPLKDPFPYSHDNFASNEDMITHIMNEIRESPSNKSNDVLIPFKTAEKLDPNAIGGATEPKGSDLDQNLTPNLPQSKPNNTRPTINLFRQGSSGSTIEQKPDRIDQNPLANPVRKGPMKLPLNSMTDASPNDPADEETPGEKRRKIKKSLKKIDFKKSETSNFEFFDPEACPANIEAAMRHRAATFIGVPYNDNAIKTEGQGDGEGEGVGELNAFDYPHSRDAYENWKEYCKCCGLTSNLKQIPICNHSLAFSYLGIGVPLYFSHLKWLGRMLFFSWILLGMYLFIYNLTGNHCEIPNTCHSYGIRMMAGNRAFVDYHLAEKV